MCLQQLFKIAFLCSPCKPLLLPSSSPFLRPSPLPNKQVRQLLFLLLRQLLLLQSRLKTKPLGRFQLLPDPPIPCNTSTLHNRIHHHHTCVIIIRWMDKKKTRGVFPNRNPPPREKINSTKSHKCCCLLTFACIFARIILLIRVRIFAEEILARLASPHLCPPLPLCATSSCWAWCKVGLRRVQN